MQARRTFLGAAAAGLAASAPMPRLGPQPCLEVEVAASDIEERNTGSGATSLDIGARLRYEIRRSFAPYAGVSWTTAPGETGERIEALDGESEDTRLVLGVRAWF